MKVASKPCMRGRRHSCLVICTAASSTAGTGPAPASGRPADTILPVATGVCRVRIVRVAHAAVAGRDVDHAVLVRLVHRHHRRMREGCCGGTGGGGGGPAAVDGPFRHWRISTGLAGNRLIRRLICAERMISCRGCYRKVRGAFEGELFHTTTGRPDGWARTGYLGGVAVVRGTITSLDAATSLLHTYDTPTAERSEAQTARMFFDLVLIGPCKQIVDNAPDRYFDTQRLETYVLR